MKSLTRFTTLAALVAVILAAAPAWVAAQQQGPGAPVTQTGTRGDAATRCDSITSAGAAQATLTLQNPGPGLSQYVTAVGSFGFVSVAPTLVVPAVITTTGFNGTSASLGFPIASATTAALTLGAVSGGWQALATPVKTNANTAATIVGPAGIIGMQQAIMACYYPAP